MAVACTSAAIAVAFLWDPTVCMGPAYYKCAGQACPHPELYCNDQYVPLRVTIAIAGVLIAVLVLTVRGRRLIQEDPAQGTR
jgi:hypothetical protein